MPPFFMRVIMNEELFNEDLNQPPRESKDNSKKALDYAIRILSIKDYSIYKMKMKLKERKFSPEEIDVTINKLLEYNYLREEEYARMRIKQLLVKGFSNSYILQKLSQEGLVFLDNRWTSPGLQDSHATGSRLLGSHWTSLADTKVALYIIWHALDLNPPFRIKHPPALLTCRVCSGFDILIRFESLRVHMALFDGISTAWCIM